ncbi:MAG: trigger factor [Alphaproteobacteria bacterium]|nr:trigger factor [Alphaproteobacteria bacterium]MDE2011393.1 trigger factor [Alphaproteobacteria bacterium]MDE2073466.1 trigger factor [Alphaproteobacteria bacterium]
MQITETVSEELRREYKVVVGAKDLDERLTGRLTEMQPRVHLKGFRPGKAPVSFLKKTYGKSMMGEIVEAAVNEGSQKAVADNSLKPAFPPRVEPVGDLQPVVEGKADLEFTVKVDLMPDFELADPAKLKVEKLVGEVADADVDESVKNLAEQTRTYSPRAEGEAAEKGDQVVMDFVGSIDGEEFEGGKAEGFNLTLGSGQLIPGFEDQLIGAKAGDAREVKVTFPEEYGAEKLAGKDAVFAVTVKEVKKPDEMVIDDELAKRVGLDSLATLKERVREQLKNDYNRASRLHLKRRILDALDEAHTFPLPPTMVEGEFDSIWRQVEEELKREGKSAEDEGKSEEDLKKEYHDIAERRVRLGLVLARLGEQNGIQITQDELNRAIAARARQFPGQEQQVFEFYAKNPQAQAEIRAPIFEEKVVDFIAELAEVSEREVPRDILFLDPDEAAEKLKAEGGN